MDEHGLARADRSGAAVGRPRPGRGWCPVTVRSPSTPGRTARLFGGVVDGLGHGSHAATAATCAVEVVDGAALPNHSPT